MLKRQIHQVPCDSPGSCLEPLLVDHTVVLEECRPLGFTAPTLWVGVDPNQPEPIASSQVFCRWVHSTVPVQPVPLDARHTEVGAQAGVVRLYSTSPFPHAEYDPIARPRPAG